jgi:glucosyl-dolichyl phosphate glucuronosyltransferase
VVINPLSTFSRYAGGMDLTVCICTHDRPAYVRDCLNGLRQQSVRRDRFAILLVDSASSPHAAAELADMAAQHTMRG